MYTDDSITFDFACLYSQDDAIFKADYCVQYFNKQEDGMLLFYWENEKCTLFD